jgi:hypothetical protein
MFKIEPRGLQYAGLFVCSILLASTPAFAQQIPHSPEPPQSIVSLAPTPKPQGAILARRPGDATFPHAPANYHVFAAASAGEDAGVEALTLNFAAETTVNRIESRSKDFIIEPGGTCHEGNHYARGGTCALRVRFNPQGPGHRLGFINISHSAESQPMNIGLIGNGYAPVVSFTPSRISTVTGTSETIKSATNLAVDGGDIVYIADIGNDLIKEIDSTGAVNTLSPFFATPASLAVDSFGAIYATTNAANAYYFQYFMPWGSQTAYQNTYAAGTCTPSAPCPLGTVGMARPANMSIDANDNLFFEEATKGAAEMPVASISGGTGSFNLWYLTDQFNYTNFTPASFAVDANGNLYNDYTYTPANTCFLLEESGYAAEYSPTANRVAGGIKCGYSGDGGLARSAEISSSIGQIAFDTAGNLYFADTGNQRIRRIDAATGIISTVAGNGTAGNSGDGHAATAATLSNPTGVGVDSQGQIYILSNVPVAGPTQSLRKVDTTGSWSYGSVLKGTGSGAKVFTVSNTGNDNLNLSAAPIMTGTNPSDFFIDSTTTSCVLTAGATLQPGRSCKLGIAFKPIAGGVRTATLQLMDNTVNGTNRIVLDGTGTLPSPTIAITSPLSGASVKTGVSVTFAVSVTTTSTTKPTGTVTFKANGVTIGSPVTLSTSGTASTTFSEPSIATYTLSAVYGGDANYATVTATRSIVVTAIKVPVKISFSPSASPALTCGASNFSAHVSSTTDGVPTGTVKLQSGSSNLASAALSNGIATLSTRTLAPGAHTLVVTYSGDSSHEPATSAPVSLTVPPWGASCRGVQPPLSQ